MAIVHLSKDNFKEEVLESKVPVLVDFWATWCGPCQTMGPLVEEIAEEQGANFSQAFFQALVNYCALLISMDNRGIVTINRYE